MKALSFGSVGISIRHHRYPYHDIDWKTWRWPGCECKPKPTEQAGPESNLRAGQVKLPQKVLIQTPEARGQELFRQPDMVPFIRAELGGELPIMILDGIELDGKDDQGSFYHVVCIGGVDGILEDMALMKALEKARSQGSFLIWAHPHQSGNTVADGLRHGFHAVEVYNHACEMPIGKGNGAFHWDCALEQQPDMLGLATDDNHFFEGYPPQVGGWIMVNAPELSPEAIMASIRKGNFYSSRGPDFKSIYIEKGNRVVAETSPIVHARLIGPAMKGKWKAEVDERNVTETHFRIPDDWAFARLEIEDAFGKKAWSNPLLKSKG